MWTQEQIDEIVAALRCLPVQKLMEAKQFVLSLKDRFGYDKPVDCRDVWTEEDEQDFTRASWLHKEQEAI
jgi:hypothetical protein